MFTCFLGNGHGLISIRLGGGIEWPMEGIFISEEYKGQNQTQNDVTVYILKMSHAFSLYGCAQCTNFTAVAVTVYENIKEKNGQI